MKQFTLCADDYALSSTISQAVITLFEYKRINATSCFVNTPHWEEHSSWLLPYRETQSIGLHFNLTLGRPLSKEAKVIWPNGFPILKKLIMQSYLHQLSQKIIESELLAQIKQFKEQMGMVPKFIDGHEHVHQLPVIRDAFIKIYQQTFTHSSCTIRIAANGILNSLRAPINKSKYVTIQLLGAKALFKAAHQYQIPHNSSFAGIYQFTNAMQYADYFPKFLSYIQDEGLIMCHPGLSAKNALDSIAVHRVHEYDYLMSQQYLADCQSVGAQLR